MTMTLVVWLFMGIWFLVWWARFIIQRHDVVLQSKSGFMKILKATSQIETTEAVAAKKGTTGKKRYLLTIDTIKHQNGDPIAGEYSMSFSAEAENIPLTAHLLGALIYLTIAFGGDYLLAHLIHVSLRWRIFYHVLLSITFPWFIYAQVFYDRPNTVKSVGSLVKWFFRRPIIRSIPTGSYLILWIPLDIFRSYTYKDYSIWVTILTDNTSLQGALLRVPVWLFAILAGLYLKLNKMYLSHCDIVGISEDPQMTYWLLAIAPIGTWVTSVVWWWTTK